MTITFSGRRRYRQRRRRTSATCRSRPPATRLHLPGLPQAHRHLHRGSLSGQDRSRIFQTGSGNSEIGGMRFRRPDTFATDPDRSRSVRAPRILSENGSSRSRRRASDLRQLFSRFLSHGIPEVGLSVQLGERYY